MQAFINHLQQHVSLCATDIETIKDCVYTEQLPAKSTILEAGQISKRLGFILDGVVRWLFRSDHATIIGQTVPL